MNILIIGGGGREHAMAWKVAQSSRVNQVWVAPGNAGTNQEKKVKNIDIKPTDIKALIDFAKKESIALTLVGPENPLALGIVDQFQQHQLRCFGPSQAAAKLESSKKFSKEFMQKANIPTAKYASFSDVHSALDYARNQPFPLVIKADGLAAGKGVVIAKTFSCAEKAIREIMEQQAYGKAGKKILIEEFLEGEEISFIVMTDSKHILPLASSQDHKKRDEGDLGPNTGGMGAYSPAPQLTQELHHKIMKTIIEPTIDAMSNQGTPYVGFLYAGLMIIKNQPYVLEFNCRLGDPETQPILMRLKTDLVSLCEAALEGRLNTMKAQWDPRYAITVVMTAGGYPDNYHKGDVIKGLELFDNNHDYKIFHAGTSIKNHDLVTSGGRVLGITALGKDLKEAQEKAYQMVSKIHWPNCFYRKDIGYRAIKQISNSK